MLEDYLNKNKFLWYFGVGLNFSGFYVILRMNVVFFSNFVVLTDITNKDVFLFPS